MEDKKLEDMTKEELVENYKKLKSDTEKGFQEKFKKEKEFKEKVRNSSKDWNYYLNLSKENPKQAQDIAEFYGFDTIEETVKYLSGETQTKDETKTETDIERIKKEIKKENMIENHTKKVEKMGYDEKTLEIYNNAYKTFIDGKEITEENIEQAEEYANYRLEMAGLISPKTKTKPYSPFTSQPSVGTGSKGGASETKKEPFKINNNEGWKALIGRED